MKTQVPQPPARPRPVDAPAEYAFVAAVSPQDARRQLRVSLALLGAMALAALAALLSHGPPAPADAARAPAHATARANVVEQPRFVRAAAADRHGSLQANGPLMR